MSRAFPLPALGHHMQQSIKNICKSNDWMCSPQDSLTKVGACVKAELHPRVMPMESPVKSAQTISGASQQSGVAFSSTTEGDVNLF